jgi:hypothetical protein
MQTWKWLYKPSFRWGFILRVVIKTAILFVIVNLAFALLDPIPWLGKVSGYNHLFRGRERLPYGVNSDISYNLSLYQLNAMFESHVVAQPKADDEFRVILIGDSSAWGFLLEPQDTLAAQINRLDLHTDAGDSIRAYNLGYPTMSLTKDLMLLDVALDYEPDLIVWLFTLESFDQSDQLDTALVQNNPDVVRDLIERYDLNLDPDSDQFVEADFMDQTVVGQRRALADLLRLQLYGVAWAETGIDQEYPDDYERVSIDLADDPTWHSYDEGSLTESDLAFDVLRAGVARAGNTPILLINEPMLISEGENSDIRYNFFYPQWVYDDYREWLTDQAAEWNFTDLWDAIPEAECYTDSPVHLTPDCSARLGDLVGDLLIDGWQINP